MICALLAAFTAVSADAIELSPGRPIAVLRGPGGVPAAHGAELVRNHLARLTGRSVILVVKGAPPAGATLIHVGRTPFVAERFGTRLDGLPRGDSYIMETVDGQLVLAGKDGFGTRAAAVEFLRQYCGVEQYIPGELGTVYAKEPPIILGEIHEEHTPPLVQRLMYSPGRNQREAGRVHLWKDFHHIIKSVDYSHNLNRLLRQTKYGQTNPELFAEVDGRRRIFKADAGSGWQPCMTNTQGIEIVADEVIRIFDAEPDRLSVSIGVNDGGNYCECKTCKPLWIRDEERKFGECGRLYYQYANRIAERVAAKHPDRILGCLAYSSAGVPPENLTLHPMLMPFVTVVTQSATTDAMRESAVTGRIDPLAKTARQFGVYDYTHGSGTYIPFIFDEALAETIRYAYAKGCRAVYFEAGQQNWGLDVYKYALALRLLWEPELDVATWKDRFFSGFYEASAPAMRRYFEVCEQAWGRVEHRGVLHRREEQMKLFTVEQIATCEQALDEAFEAAPDDLVAQRVLMTRRAFSLSAALGRRYWAAVRAREVLGQEDGLHAALGILEPVAGPDHDYAQLYAEGSGRDLYVTAQPPGEGSVRMEETYGEIRVLLFRSILDDVARAVGVQRELRVRDIALRRVQEIFADVTRSPGGVALLSAALKTGSCVARARRTAEAPVVDGRLDEKVWREAEALGNFVGYGTGASARYPTTARVLQTSDTLYFGFACTQPPDVLWAAAGMHDGPVWMDDSVEVLINRPGETDPDRFLQFIVNVEATVFDMRNGESKWNGEIEVKASPTKTGWQLEAALPLSHVREYVVDGTLHLNLARNRQKSRVVKGVRRWDKYDEISSWFPSFKGNANLLSRGWLLLDGR